MTAAVPSFGIVGTTGVESQGIGGGVTLLELVDGTAIQQFRRMAQPNQDIQRVTLTAWGITPLTSPFAIYPEQVTLAAQEESVQHEIARISTPVINANATKFDAMLIFRARCTLTVSGKCNTTTAFDDPFAVAWPTSVTSALGGVTLTSTLIAGSGTHGTLVLTDARVQKIAADWHTFNYTYSWIFAGSGDGTTHVLNTPAGITAPTEAIVPGHTRQFQWTLTDQNFAQVAGSFQVFPRS